MKKRQDKKQRKPGGADRKRKDPASDPASPEAITGAGGEESKPSEPSAPEPPREAAAAATDGEEALPSEPSAPEPAAEAPETVAKAARAVVVPEIRPPIPVPASADTRYYCDFVTDPDHKVRAAALRALARLKDPDAFPHVAKTLRDNAPAVRIQAAWTLISLGGERARPLLRGLAADDDEGVRKAAAEILEELPGG